MLWTVVALCLIVAVVVLQLRLRSRRRAVDGGEETGAAILEFGRAFPGEAIRAVVSTADGRVIFLRLHDGKAGCMRAGSHHFTCHLIEPGTVHVEAVDERRLSVAFANRGFEGGVFEFRTAGDAAEVSLWLLGSFMARPAD
ncbi:hypothetical protein KYK29_10850 [Shinella daejeonensis]|uniref:hypothetical protein n=1 Tax=Shinella daejeonensis TaxID=659017 RepID=UPI0020C77175|nr:hypothetical protein [Shinella daejeonensis]MCP8895424.1 hypothetical protein [Shinella daejeonensis]